MKLAAPYFRQRKDFTCGAVSLQTVLAYWGDRVTRKRAIEEAGTTEATGTRRSALASALRRRGYRVRTKTNAAVRDLRAWLARGVPVIVNYREPSEEIGHYAVVIGLERGSVVMHDPWNGPSFALPEKAFLARWHGYHRKAHRRWMLAAVPK